MGKNRKDKNTNAYEKTKKPVYKRWWFWVIIVIIIIAVICTAFGGGDNEDVEEEIIEETTEASSPIYELAEVVDMYNGAGTSVIGYYSFVEIDSAEVEFEDIEEWYFDYVLENTEDFEWFAIIYTDTEKLDSDANSNYEAIYSNGTMVVTDVTVIKDRSQSHSSYSVSGLAEGTTYFGDEESKSLYESE